MYIILGWKLGWGQLGLSLYRLVCLAIDREDQFINFHNFFVDFFQEREERVDNRVKDSVGNPI